MPASLKLLVDVVSPVFAVILVGGLVGGWFRLDVRHVNRLALYAAVPALAFRAMAELALGEIPALRLLAGYGLFLLAAAGLAALAGARLPGSARRALIGTSVLGNAANLNLPVALFAFGPAGLDRALILYLATSLLMFTIGPGLLGAAVSPGRALRTVLAFPVLWATLAGLLVNGAGLGLPLAAERAVDLLADAAIPMVLLTLGVQLARAGRHWPSGRAWAGVALKLGAGPFLAAGAGLALGLTGLDLAILVLIGAMPTAVNAAMLAIEFGGDARQVGDTVVAGTATALITLPLVLSVLSGLVGGAPPG